MMDKLEREVERFLQPIDRPHLGHLELVEACKARDADRAARLIAEHLGHVGARAVARLQEAADNGELPTGRSGTGRGRSAVNGSTHAAL